MVALGVLREWLDLVFLESFSNPTHAMDAGVGG